MKEDLIKIINYHGVQKQTTIWIEELSELIKEICKWQRNFEEWGINLPDKNFENTTKEMADVENIIEQMKIVLKNNFGVLYERGLKIKES